MSDRRWGFLRPEHGGLGQALEPAHVQELKGLPGVLASTHSPVRPVGRRWHVHLTGPTASIWTLPREVCHSHPEPVVLLF